MVELGVLFVADIDWLSLLNTIGVYFEFIVNIF
jgi:hypothetical protein